MSFLTDLLGNLFSGFFAHRVKRTEGQTAVAVKAAVDGNIALEHFYKRLEKLEQRVEVLDRFRDAYETLVPLVHRLVRVLRARRKPDPDLLDELERTPTSAQIVGASSTL